MQACSWDEFLTWGKAHGVGVTRDSLGSPVLLASQREYRYWAFPSRRQGYEAFLAIMLGACDPWSYGFAYYQGLTSYGNQRDMLAGLGEGPGAPSRDRRSF
jgi:hypothetical protein